MPRSSSATVMAKFSELSTINACQLATWVGSKSCSTNRFIKASRRPAVSATSRVFLPVCCRRFTSGANGCSAFGLITRLSAASVSKRMCLASGSLPMNARLLLASFVLSSPAPRYKCCGANGLRSRSKLAFSNRSCVSAENVAVASAKSASRIQQALSAT